MFSTSRCTVRIITFARRVDAQVQAISIRPLRIVSDPFTEQWTGPDSPHTACAAIHDYSTPLCNKAIDIHDALDWMEILRRKRTTMTDPSVAMSDLI